MSSFNAENEPEKKCKLRTASDVISRLIWDDSLPESNFVVGYLDRFKGIVEKPFTTLDWSDPSIVDNDTLALPKHRIQYFKYKNKKVWDKRLRRDIIFGSTGDPCNIHDFMAKVDEEELYFCCEDEHVCLDQEDTDMTTKVVPENDEERANYFVAARIIDDKTVENLTKVAAQIKLKDPILGDCCIKKDLYHITLATVKLDTSEEITDAVVALSDLQMQSIQIPNVKLENLNIFQHRVLYASINENKQLMELRKLILQVLEEWKVKLVDKFVFVPHVTIVKTSRPIARLRGSKYIGQDLYLKYAEDEFGSEIIDKLYLCEMGEGRREDGFYNCAAEFPLR